MTTLFEMQPSNKAVTCIKLEQHNKDGLKCDLTFTKDSQHIKNKLSKTWLFSTYKLSLWNFKDVQLNVPASDKPRVKVYKLRYFILCLFCLCSGLNAFQFIQYSIISNIIECYFKVTPYDVNWTSTVYMIVYAILVLPVSWFLNRFGMRSTVLVGSFLNCLSSATQCISLNSNGFPIVLFSQTLSAVAQVFILPVPSSLAAAWFPSQQVGRATAIGVFANLIGSAIGFVIPTLVVTNDCTNPQLIKYGRSIIAYGLTAANLANFLLLVPFFKRKPPLPPVETSSLQSALPFQDSLLALVKSRNFISLLIIYGLVTGVTLTLGTLINQIFEPLYKNSEQSIGLTAIGTIIAGFIGSYIGEYVTDTTRKYRQTSLTYCVCASLTMLAVAGSFFSHIMWLQFLAVLVNGFFITGYFPIGIDYAAEITYPEPEGISASLMNASQMAFSAVITVVGSHLLQSNGPKEMTFFFLGTLTAATILCYFMKPELKRTNAHMENSPEENK